jgi:hypothetical protein
MGGAHGAELLAAVLGAAALLALGGLGRIAFARRRPTWAQAKDLLSESLPLEGPLPVRAGLLLAGATAIFAASEALEGHGLASFSWAVFALPVAAAAVAYLTRHIAGWLAHLGLTLRTVFGDLSITIGRPRFALLPVAALGRSSDAGRAHRGRAPPTIA